jgi:hypothetical protein
MMFHGKLYAQSFYLGCFMLTALLTNSHALPFNVMLKEGTVTPTGVGEGTGVAYFSVFNNTSTQRNNNFLKYKPAAVTQVTQAGTYPNTCDTLFNLAPKGQPGDSCTLQLLIAGGVNPRNPNPQDHLFVCFPGGKTCSGTTYSFEVKQTQRAYVANFGNRKSSPGIYLCTLNGLGGFDSCTLTPAMGSPLWKPNDVAVAITNGIKYAYIADDARHIYQCNIISNGEFSNCALTPANNAPNWLPGGINFETVSGVQYAYVASYGYGGGPTMSQCTLNIDGSFNTCVSTPASGAPNWALNSVNFNVAADSQLYAYTTDRYGKKVYHCSVNADGSFNSCAITPTNDTPNWRPSDIAFATFNGTQYAYVASDSGGIGGVYQCTLNNDGTFNTCALLSAAGPANGWRTLGITISKTSDVYYAYVGSAKSDGRGNLADGVYQCTFDTTNGTFKTCALTPSTNDPINLPVGLSITDNINF